MSPLERSTLPTIIVIFGITGDLSRRKLLPALFRLHRKNLLPKMLQIIGFSRAKLADADLRELVETAVRAADPEAEEEAVHRFARAFVYRQGLFQRKRGYEELAQYLGRQDGEWRVCSNKLFYLAVPPRYYRTIFKNLAASGLTIPCSPEEGWTRVIVEKPFGRNLRTAESLDALLGKLFREEQIYRIDHYLGKETVQNILAFRFSNTFLDPAWSHRSVERMEFRVFETIGVEGRGSFYDAVGALRDVGQNHLLQLLALFTMERPETFDAEAIRAERLAALRAVKRLTVHDVAARTARGQYDGYRKEPGVAPNSGTETYFRIEAAVDTPAWRGVPFILENGKKMSEAKAEVAVVFKHREPCLCPAGGPHYRNVLRYRIQPDEGIAMSFWIKRPGADMVIEEKDFSFDYAQAYARSLFFDAYEKLLLDTVNGNQTLFISTDEIKASWRFIDPIIRAWKHKKTPLILYPAGAPAVVEPADEALQQ